MVESVISMMWSSMRRWIHEAPKPTARPTTVPPSAIHRNSPTAQPAEKSRPSTTTAATMAKSTAAAPSLNRLSASTSVVSRSETPSLRNSATTLTGSVAAMSAPKSSATPQARPPSRCTPAAVSANATNTPGSASTAMRRHWSRSRVASRL